MTFVYKSATVNNYVIELYQNKFDTVYRVAVYPVVSDNLLGYAVSDLSYTTEKQAINRFNSAKRYYSKI